MNANDRKTVRVAVPLDAIRPGFWDFAAGLLIHAAISHDDLATLGYCDVEEIIRPEENFAVVRLRLSARHPSRPGAIYERRIPLSLGVKEVTDRLLDLVNAPAQAPLFETVEITDKEWILRLRVRTGARGGKPLQTYPSR